MTVDERPAVRKARMTIPGGAYVGLAIALIGVAMILQACLFDGDKLSPAGRALLTVW